MVDLPVTTMGISEDRPASHSCGTHSHLSKESELFNGNLGCWLGILKQGKPVSHSTLSIHSVTIYLQT